MRDDHTEAVKRVIYDLLNEEGPNRAILDSHVKVRLPQDVTDAEYREAIEDLEHNGFVTYAPNLGGRIARGVSYHNWQQFPLIALRLLPQCQQNDR